MSPSDARLRRLDALFAEKVLGEDLSVECDGHPDEDGIATWRCDTCAARGRWDETIAHNRTPRSYTRSLDAACEGARTLKVDFAVKNFGFSGESSAFWNVKHNQDFRGSHVCLYADVAASYPHPAEALVIACLRAVGCTEEELNEPV